MIQRTRPRSASDAAPPPFTEAVDRDILRFNDIIDTKCLAAFIFETHGLAVSEFDVVLRARDLEGARHD